MFKRTLPLLAVLLMAVSVVQAAEPSALRIGVANTTRIFSEMQELKDLKQKMDGEQRLLQGVNQEKQGKLASLKAERDALKQDTPQAQDKNAEYLRTAIEYETWAKLTESDLQRKLKMQTKGLFDKIEAATAEVAKQKGLDLVLTDQHPEFPEDLDRLTVDQVRGLITARSVLYASEKVDLSSAVLAALDAKYKSPAK